MRTPYERNRKYVDPDDPSNRDHWQDTNEIRIEGCPGTGEHGPKALADERARRGERVRAMVEKAKELPHRKVQEEWGE